MKTECTFQEACTKCKKEGGIFYARDVPAAYKYSWDKDRKIFINECGRQFEFDGSEFDMVWIYEPPQKSAFQEWSDRTPHPWNDDISQIYIGGRQEGWNAHHEAVYKIIGKRRYEQLEHALLEEIKKLREP
jgi:hypothetical protein